MEEKINEEKEKVIIKAKAGLKQLRKEEKVGGKKKIVSAIPPKSKKK